MITHKIRCTVRNGMFSWKAVFFMGFVFSLLANVQASGYQQYSQPGDPLVQLVVMQDQEAEQMRITMRVEEFTLPDALDVLAKKLRVGLSYHTDVMPDKEVTLNMTNVSVFDVLAKILEGTNLEAVLPQDRDVIVIREKEQVLPEEEIYQETITGRVLDAQTGEPLPGVNVVISSQDAGTATDMNGEFELIVETLQDTLIFSYIGYQTQEVALNGREELEISLVPQAISGDELVVIGYGAVRRSDLTGSIVSLSAEGDAVNRGGSVSNIDQMLQGRVAGMQVTQSSGAPGSGVSVRIRGINSIQTNNEPLYVIDGQPIDNTSSIRAGGHFPNPISSNPLNSLNTEDIASIEVLKDASATAIYGARGANGVILITTKKGRGDLNIDYSSSLTISEIAKKLDVMTVSEYTSVMNELSAADGGNILFSPDDIRSFGNGTNWQDEILKTSASHQHALSLSSREGNSSYYASLNYMFQDGIVINSDFERLSGRFNYEYDKDAIRLGFNLTTSRIGENIAPTGATEINYMADAISHAINAPPIYSVYDEHGNYVQPWTGAIASVSLDNPVAVANEVFNERSTNRTFGNVFAEYRFLPTLIARVRLAGDWQNIKSDAYRSTLTFRGSAFGGIGQAIAQERTSSLLEGIVNYVNTFDDHSLNLLAGYTYENFESGFMSAAANEFPSDVLRTNDLSTGSSDTYLIDSNRAHRRMLSYLGRVNYNYADKYLVTASMRVDGSSNFGRNNKYGFFPSLAVVWRPVNESFWTINEEVISDLRLRGSWGLTGNDQIGVGQAIVTYSSAGNALFGESLATAIAPSRIPNPDLRWEATSQFNFGIDIDLYSGRLSGSVEYYRKSTRDMLLNLPVPNSSGYNSITQNIGEVENSGLEVTLNSRNIMKNDFMWTTSFNISTLKNEVTDLGPLSRITLRSGTVILEPGLPAFSYFGYRMDGVFQEGDDIENSAQPLALPGHPRWYDANGDGQINEQDRVNLGNPFPDYTFGIGNTFNFRNLELNIFIEGAQGHQLLNWGLVDALFPNDPYRNRLAGPLVNRWTPENPANKWPSSVNPSSYVIGDGSGNTLVIEDASYIRLKNVQLSYRIPVEKIAGLRSASIFVNGENLALITKYSGYDPDVSTQGQSNIRIDRNAYPRQRSFTVGLRLGL